MCKDEVVASRNKTVGNPFAAAFVRAISGCKSETAVASLSHGLVAQRFSGDWFVEGMGNIGKRCLWFKLAPLSPKQ